MIQALEHVEERVFDLLNVAQRQIAFIQLSVAQPLIHDAINDLANRLGRGGAFRARRRFDAIGQHEQAGFARLGFGTGIAINLFIRRRRGIGLNRFAMKIRGERRPVMLRNEIANPPRQPVLLGKRQPAIYVVNDNRRALLRFQRIVDIYAFQLVLDEHLRIARLAHVVVIRRNSYEQRVSADLLRGMFGELADDETVMIRAGRIAQKFLQERMRGPRQINQLQRRRNPKQFAQHK